MWGLIFVFSYITVCCSAIRIDKFYKKKYELMSHFKNFEEYKKALSEQTKTRGDTKSAKSEALQKSTDQWNVTLTKSIYAQKGKMLITVAQCDETTYRIQNGTEKIAKNAFVENQITQRIEIPSSVTVIENSAFDGCKNIEWYEVDKENPNYYSIDGVLYEKSDHILFKYPMAKKDNLFRTPSNTTKIADRAFKGSIHLREISISSSVVNIAADAFEGNCNLREINVEGGNPYYTSIDGILYDKEIKKLILFVNKEKTEFTIPPTVTHIGYNAFSHCHQIKRVFLPKEISIIGDSAFAHCYAMRDILLPESILSIGNLAFEDCTSLSEINLPTHLYTLGNWAFKNCVSLTKINLPNTLSSVPNGCFEQCTALKSINIPSSAITIGENAFSFCSSLSHVELSQNTIQIKDWAFSHCSSLSEIKLPQSIQSIGISVFECCESLLSITIPSQIKEIPNAVFKECKKLTYIDLPQSVYAIKQWAFSGCSSLTDITLPNTITQIESWAFCQCESLSFITLPEHLKQLKKWTLWQCPRLKTVDLPIGLQEIEDWAFSECGELSDLHILHEDPNILKIGKETFDRTTYEKCTLHVPDGTTNNYLQHPIFSKFKRITSANQ